MTSLSYHSPNLSLIALETMQLLVQNGTTAYLTTTPSK